jgi:hypothetical protein
MITNRFKTTKRLMTVVHFNRIAMMRKEEHVWTVHNSIGCFQVKEVRINTPMHTVFKPNGVQPRAKFKGPAIIEVLDGIATLR